MQRRIRGIQRRHWKEDMEVYGRIKVLNLENKKIEYKCVIE